VSECASVDPEAGKRMIKLYGFTMSNYFNMVKMALLEKEIAFEVVDIRGSQDENFLKMPDGESAMHRNRERVFE
jgi:hypothetical protein